MSDERRYGVCDWAPDVAHTTQSILLNVYLKTTSVCSIAHIYVLLLFCEPTPVVSSLILPVL